MKKYYLIATDYEFLDERFYTKFAEENGIALVNGAFNCWGQPKVALFSEAEARLVLFRIIEFCDGVLVDKSYRRRRIAKDLLNYAKTLGKDVRFASKQWKLRKEQTEYWENRKVLKEEDND